MRNSIALMALAATLAAPVAVPTAASAQRYDSHGHRIYHGYGGRYRYRCKRSSGTTGLVAGAVGGGLIGNALGGGTIGTLVGAGGGALLGKHLDQKHDAAQNRRNGC